MSTMKWPLGSRESMHEAREEYWLACLDIDTLFRRAGWPPPPRTHRLQARREGDVRTQGIHAAAVQVDRRRAPRGATHNKAAVIEAAHARGWPVDEADAVGLAALEAT